VRRRHRSGDQLNRAVKKSLRLVELDQTYELRQPEPVHHPARDRWHIRVTASTHWIATAVGMGILERGGNPIDAGVATAFTLQIVEPHLNGAGGDVPIMVHDVKRGQTEVICGQGPAPGDTTISHYESLGP
jgi:gamma-glutamyltranspeptidase